MTEVFGQQFPSTTDNEYNTLAFVVRQLLQKMQTVTLVRVMAVTNSGGVTPVGTVDVRPLVNQMTGDRTAVEHATIFKIPYFRLQGGGNAVILDPQVGDIGMCAFASRDISAVKAAKDTANPGSFRQYDWADGLYFGGLLNGVPTQYIRFHAGGVDIKAPTITLDGDVHITGDTNSDGAITAAGDVTGEGTSLHTHIHSGVQPGGGNSGPPV